MNATNQIQNLSTRQVEQLLAIPDLSKDNTHSIGLLVEQIKASLNQAYDLEPEIVYGSPIVSLDDNYYALNYSKNEITLSSRYTKYIDENNILRTQMSSVVPSLLRQYKKDNIEGNRLYLCPGKVYRRDVRDKTHVGEPHQCDIWYVTKEKQTREDLLKLVQLLIKMIEKILNKKVQWRYSETVHNYTDNGIEVELLHNGQWLEILECGLIGQKILEAHELSNLSGLALGLGLERLVMIIKDISDIRTLYSEDSRIKMQLTNLKKYKEVSKQPSIKRDLSICVEKDVLIEELTEKIYSMLDNELTSVIETVQLVNEYSYESLPQVARDRLGINTSQKNMLLRVTLRDLSRSLTSEDANNAYTKIYKLLHVGTGGYSI